MSTDDFIQLTRQMRTAQKAYWHFTGDTKMKRRLLLFALDLEAEVDRATIDAAPSGVLAFDPSQPLSEELRARFIELLRQYNGNPPAIMQALPADPLRAREEIQKAHDMLAGIVLHEVPADQFNSGTMLGIRSSLDALCWVLQHDHNETFAQNMATILADLKARGYDLEFSDLGPKVRALVEQRRKASPPGAGTNS